MCAPRMFMPVSSGSRPTMKDMNDLFIQLTYTLSPATSCRPSFVACLRSIKPASCAAFTACATHSRSVLPWSRNAQYFFANASIFSMPASSYLAQAFFLSMLGQSPFAIAASIIMQARPPRKGEGHSSPPRDAAYRLMFALRACAHRSLTCSVYIRPSLMKCVPHWRNSKCVPARRHCSRRSSTQS